MHRSLSVRTPSSPFKSVEDRDINQETACIGCVGAGKHGACRYAEAEVSGECAAALLEFAPTFDDEAPDGESENGFISFENCIDAMQKAVAKAETSIVE